MIIHQFTVAGVAVSMFVGGCASRSTVRKQGEVPAISAANSSRGDTTVTWLNVAGPNGSIMPIAVLRPHGNGPFPTVIILHGTHGFAKEYLQLGRDIAAHGVLSVAACWFSGRRGAGTQFITPLECANAPPLPPESEPNRFLVARPSIAALVKAVKRLPDVRSDEIALFGHSRGGGAALNYVLSDTGTVAALVLNSTGYPPEVVSKASTLNVPILILHGTADAPADGGSPLSAIGRAREFEAVLRSFRKQVEAKYYEGGRHNGLFDDRAQYRDEVQRVAAFILAHAR